MDDNRIKEILHKFNQQQIYKIEDFLVSEIDTDNLKETIEFVNSDDKNKKEKFTDILYQGNKYDGLFLEGNQYLLSSSASSVTIIDMLGEEQGIAKEDTQVQMEKEKFIELIKNKKKVFNLIKGRSLGK